MRDKVVVVTGATAGVGRALVRELASRGVRLALLARDPERLEATRREVEQAGGTALPISVDVADADAVEHAAAAVERELGAIDVWINNAMVTVLSSVADTPAEEFRRVTEVTYLGVVHGTLSALRRMRPRDEGHIVQVGSALSYRAIPLQAAYCAAKHAVRGFTDSLRSELIHDGSRVMLTMVQLPAMNTTQFEWGKTRLPNQPRPVPPIYQPEVAARSIVAILGKRRREVFVGGSTVKAILGSRLLPAVLDHYLARLAYSGQQTEDILPPGRQDNLFQPVRGDRGAHGPFDERSRTRSPQAWLATHRLAAAGIGALGAAAAAIGLSLLPRD